MLVPEGWINVPNQTELRLCQISRQDVPSTPPVVVTQSLVVESDHSWMLYVHSHRVDPSHIPPFDDTPHLDSASTITSLFQRVCSLNTGVGNPDTKIRVGKTKEEQPVSNSEAECSCLP